MTAGGGLDPGRARDVLRIGFRRMNDRFPSISITNQATGKVAENAGRLLSDRIRQRTGIAGTSGGTRLEISLSLSAELDREEFVIRISGENSLQILGGDEPALIYGAGYLLRNARYEPGVFIPKITGEI